MAFTSLKKIVGTILLVGAIGSGCATSPEEEAFLKKNKFPSDTKLIPIELTCPEILTKLIPAGSVNGEYNAKIKAKGDYLHYSLKKAPEYITIDNNGKISFKPHHIENRKLEVIVSNSSCSAEKEFDLVVYPYIDPETLKSYDYYNEIIKYYILVAETPAKKVFIDTDFKYYDAKSKGLEKAWLEQFEMNGSDVHDERKPLLYHLTEDNTCEQRSEADRGYLNGKDICTFAYELSLSKKWPIFCINPEEPLKEPTKPINTCQCVGRKASIYPCSLLLNSIDHYYTDPTSLEDQSLQIHETQHAINTGIFNNIVNSIDESLAASISAIISDRAGGRSLELDSFCDLSNTWNPGSNPYKFWYDFCNYPKQFGTCLPNANHMILYNKYNWTSPNNESNFDVYNLPLFFEKANYIINFCKYRATRPLSINQLKCVMDGAVGDNTYPFLESRGFSNASHSYCGDIEKLPDREVCNL